MGPEAARDAHGRLAEAGIWIDDTGAASVLEMRAKCRRLHSMHGLDLVERLTDETANAAGSAKLSLVAHSTLMRAGRSARAHKIARSPRRSPVCTP